MTKYLAFIFLLLSTSCLTSSSDNIDDLNKGATLATVNGNEIREGYLELLSRVNPRIGAQIANPMARKKLVDNLVEQELLYQESLKLGLDKKKDVLEKIALYKRVIIAQALLEESLSKSSREYYDKNKASEFTKMKISHIEFDFIPENTKAPQADKKPAEPTPADKNKAMTKAREAYLKLKSGADFAKLAQEISDDKSTARKGGDLGAVGKDDKKLARRGLSRLSEAAFLLKQGEFSEPIETKKGYHIVMAVSEPKVEEFNEVEKIIRFEIQKQTKGELIDRLKKDAKIDIVKSSLQVVPEAATPSSQKEEGHADEHEPKENHYRNKSISVNPVIKFERKAEQEKTEKAPENTKPAE